MRLHRMYCVIPLLAFSILIVACSKREMAEADATAAAESSADAGVAIMAEAASDNAAAAAPQKSVEAPAMQGPGVDPSQMASEVASQVDPQRRFIRTAQAQFQVVDVYRTALAIEDEVAAQGGFVVQAGVGLGELSEQLGRPTVPLGGTIDADEQDVLVEHFAADAAFGWRGDGRGRHGRLSAQYV